jgi:hypothetical protein
MDDSTYKSVTNFTHASFIVRQAFRIVNEGRSIYAFGTKRNIRDAEYMALGALHDAMVAGIREKRAAKMAKKNPD